MNVDVLPDDRIGTTPCPTCALCGTAGEQIHSALKDRLFGATGSWNLKKCPSHECGLVWLDPMPLPEEIGKAYARYYTHSTAGEGGQAGLVKRIYQRMKRGYIANKYGYRVEECDGLTRMLGRLLYFFPLRRNSADNDVRYLKATPGGRLLDVGCGSGDWLLAMSKLGWQVEGLDFDEGAVNAGKAIGLQLRCGALEQQQYADESFDVITLHHVIEHVPDPAATIAECRRVLKKGGRLLIFTPNNASLSHRIFGNDWRGLEPPRHLHIFAPQSLQRLFGKAGFKTVSLYPQIAYSVIYESFLLRRGAADPVDKSRRVRSAWACARFFNLVELCFVKLRPQVADCMGMMAVKE